MSAPVRPVGLVSDLGAWVSELAPEAIPVSVREKIRDHLLDTIGAGIVGNGRAPVEIVERSFRAPGASPLLIDAPARDLRDAVRVNAIAAHAAEIDDAEGCDHTGAVTVPVLLALLDSAARGGAARGGAVVSGAVLAGAPSASPAAGPAPSGDEYLTALVAGYEVGRRVQNALGGYDAHNSLGWHSTATCGVFAAAATAARALRLSPEQTSAALGIAASSSAGTWAFAADGAMTKQLHASNAAAAGLQAAMLAANGAAGPGMIFDDVWGGFFATHGGGAADPAQLTAGLGDRWHATHSAIKMYAACRSAHAPLDGVVDVLGAGEISPADVDAIGIEVHPYLRRMICPEQPRTIEAARMSLPIALALLLGGRGIEDPDVYEGFADPEILAAADEVSIVERADLDPQRVIVTLRRKEGEPVVVEREFARGSERAPFSAEQVRRKFLRLTTPRIGAQAAERCLAYVDALDREPVVPLPEIWGAARPVR